MTNPQK